MKRSVVSVIFIVMVILTTVISLSGCRDDDGVNPNPRPKPTLENIWPNEDGTTWEFDYVWRIWSLEYPTRTYDDPADVPPVPSLDEIEELLENHPKGDNPSERFMKFKLEFDGDMTTAGGATGQNLKETIEEIPTPGAARTLTVSECGHSFLYSLAIARPDLRERIAPHLPADLIERLRMEKRPSARMEGIFDYLVTGPTILFGYAWEKTEDYIGTYGDIDAFLAYKYLESNLNPGHDFTFQLLPSLASDIFLHCRVLRRFDYKLDWGGKMTAIECLYIVDFGIAQGTIYDPQVYHGVFDYGTITYVMDVGPVRCYERSLVEPGTPVTLGLGEHELDLLEMTPGSTP